MQQHSGGQSSDDSAANAVSEALGGVLGSSAAAIARAARKPKPQLQPPAGNRAPPNLQHQVPGSSGGTPAFTYRRGEAPAAPSLAGLRQARLPIQIPAANTIQRVQPNGPVAPTSAIGSRSNGPPNSARPTNTAIPSQNDSKRPAAATHSPSVVKIDIPPILESVSPGDHGFDGLSPPVMHSTNGGREQSEFRRRKSIQNPLGLSQQQQQHKDVGGGSGLDQRDSNHKTAAAPSLRSPASAALRYTSAFLRRKQPFLASEQSGPSRAPHSFAENLNEGSRFSNRLFFQDATASEPSERSQSQTPSQASLSSSPVPDAEPDNLSTAVDTATDGGGGGSAAKKKTKAKTKKNRSHTPKKPSLPLDAKGSPSRHPQFEKIGDLSREEDEFDFAILLKPSKYEERLDLPLSSDANQPLPSSSTELLETKQDSNSREGTVANLVLPVSIEPSRHLRDLKPQKDPTRARNLIIARIKSTGLQVKRLLSLDGKQTLLKVKAPQHVLEIGAERMKLRKLRKFDQIWMEFSRELRATFADYDEQHGGVRFIDSEKQSIVHSLLTTSASNLGCLNDRGGGAFGTLGESLGAGLNEFCPLKTKYVVQMFPLHKQDLGVLKRHWVTFWRAPDAALIGDTAGALGSASGLTSKPKSCCGRLATEALSQPIDQVAQYFGEKVAFYFAWMEMYTRWLVVPSGVGLVLFCLQVTSKKIDHPLAPLYAIFMALWTSAFLIAWKRKASALAYRWGTLGYEEDTEVTRPEFYGDPAISTAGNKKYPSWKRYLKYLITMPTVLGSMALTMTITFFAFSTRDRLEQNSLETRARAKHLAEDITSDLKHGLTLENLKRLSALGLEWQFWFYFLITPMLYGLLIPVLDFFFTKWARVMTNWENHETESRYQSHLILKVFSFRFVHVFASLYYYAFVDYSHSDNLLRVAIQLASFMVAGQLWKNVMETLYPFVRRRWQMQQKKKDTNTQFNHSTVFNVNVSGASSGVHRRRNERSAGRMAGNTAHGNSAARMMFAGGGGVEMNNSNAVIHEQCVRLEQASDKAWEEAELQQYDTFEDYTEMLIQFGYVSFFSLAFPLAPLLALLNNVFELRTDAFKLCHTKQRPIAHKASGIGIWFHVLQLMSVLVVLTNCLHIAFTTTLLERLFPRDAVSESTKVWLAFGVEHLLLMLKVGMMVAIPSMPRDVQDKVRVEREQAKQESARAMAAKMLLLATAVAAAAERDELADPKSMSPLQGQ